MSDVQGFFQFINLERCEVLPFTAYAADTLATGFLAKINSDGTIQQAGVTDIPDGFALTQRTLIYAPTTMYAAANEPISLVRGPSVQFLADNNAFVGGSLPAFGANLYVGAGGRLTTSGASVEQLVGRVLGNSATNLDLRTPPNSSGPIVHCEAIFGTRPR